LQIVPFIRFIGLTGSLARDIAKTSSDIDFFIVTSAGRIWTCRFFTVVMLKILGLYPKGEECRKRAGKICTNRFVTDKYLVINPQNRYHAEEYSRIAPLFDSDSILEKFYKKNIWMQNFGYYPAQRVISLVQSAGILSTIRRISEFILSGSLGNAFESYCKKFQLKSIMKNPLANQSDSGIYVDDNELRFHPKPRK